MNTTKRMILFLFLFALFCGFPLKNAQSDSDIEASPLDYSSANSWIVFGEGEETDFCDFGIHFFLFLVVAMGIV